MSEKRFVYHNEHFPLNVREIVDNENGETYDCEGATDVLNELFDKNKQLKEENEQLKIANARWLDKSLQDKQIRYSNANHKELTTKYLQLKEENEQLRKQLDFYLLDEFEWKEKYGD